MSFMSDVFITIAQKYTIMAILIIIVIRKIGNKLLAYLFNLKYTKVTIILILFVIMIDRE